MKAFGIKVLEYLGLRDSPGSFRLFASRRAEVAAAFLFVWTVLCWKLATVVHIF